MSKTIFITGTSTGLGKETAINFAKNGWNVVASMRSPEKDKELSSHKSVRVVKLDVTDILQVKTAIAQAIAAFGKIDVVVNNAGVGMYGALELTEEKDIDNQYAVNVRGVINVIRGFLPHFRQNKGGMFINIGSVMGRTTALPLGSLYNMSKFALEGLIEGLYYELKPLNIDVKLIEPGGFSSDFSSNIVFSKSDTITDYKVITEKVEVILNAIAKNGSIDTLKTIVTTIFDLANGKNTEFRTLVGEDAKMLLKLRESQSIETFLESMSGQF